MKRSGYLPVAGLPDESRGGGLHAAYIHLAIISVIILTFAVSILAYPGLPDMIPSHWDASGQVDGYLPKLSGAFLVPLIMAGFLCPSYIYSANRPETCKL